MGVLSVAAGARAEPAVFQSPDSTLHLFVKYERQQSLLCHMIVFVLHRLRTTRSLALYDLFKCCLVLAVYCVPKYSFYQESEDFLCRPLQLLRPV